MRKRKKDWVEEGTLSYGTGERSLGKKWVLDVVNNPAATAIFHTIPSVEGINSSSPFLQVLYQQSRTSEKSLP